MQTQAEYDKRKKAIGLTGAIIGAGVALVAGKYLSDKKNRKKVMNKITTLKEEMVDGIKDITPAMMDEKPKKMKKAASQKKVLPKKKASPQKKAAEKKPRDEKGHFIKAADKPNTPKPSDPPAVNPS